MVDEKKEEEEVVTSEIEEIMNRVEEKIADLPIEPIQPEPQPVPEEKEPEPEPKEKPKPAKSRGIYRSLEEKWYAFLNIIDKYIPIYKIIDPIDRVIPSFVLFLAALFLFLLVILLIVAALLIILPGGGEDVTLENMVRSLPEVSTFLDEFPDAEISIYDQRPDEISNKMDFIRENCGGELPVKFYYFAVVESGNEAVYVWIDGETKDVVCINRVTGHLDECRRNADCDDNDASTNDECRGTPKMCINTPISECTAGDDFCPPGCDSSNDADCQPDPCEGVRCQENQKCVNGSCELKECSEQGGEICSAYLSCPSDFIPASDTQRCCLESCSEEAPCAGVTCPDDKKCVDGICVFKSCSEMNGVICASTQTCSEDVVETADTDECCIGICVTAQECETDSQCNDHDPSTLDACSGETTKVCTHVPITWCADGDNYCPPDCTYSNDNDCPILDECQDDSECDDGDVSTRDECSGSPKVCVNTPITDCISGDGYCPPGCHLSDDNDCPFNITFGGDVVVADCVASFYGDDDYVEIDDHPELDITDQMSIVAWVNPYAYRDWDRIVAKPWPTNDPPWNVYTLNFNNEEPAKANFIISINSLGYNAKTTSIIPLNRWTFLVGTYDGATMRIYFNGVEEDSKSVSGSINTNNMPVYVGHNVHIPQTQDFYGKIAEARIYSRALSSTEIEQLYEDPTALTTDPALALYLPFDSCFPDLCEGITCQDNQKCVDGICVLKDCSEIEGGNICTGTEICSGSIVQAADTEQCCIGECQTFCSPSCEFNQNCVDGTCVLKSCSEMGGITCAPEQVCLGTIYEASDVSECCIGSCGTIPTNWFSTGRDLYSGCEDIIGQVNRFMDVVRFDEIGVPRNAGGIQISPYQYDPNNNDIPDVWECLVMERIIEDSQKPGNGIVYSAWQTNIEQMYQDIDVYYGALEDDTLAEATELLLAMHMTLGSGGSTTFVYSYIINTGQARVNFLNSYELYDLSAFSYLGTETDGSSGDADQDGTTNIDELNNCISSGECTKEEFLDAVLDPTKDGTA